MAISSLSATNFSVKNAQEFVNTVKSGSRILSFFIGGTQTETSTNLNTEQRRFESFKDASVIRQIEPAHVNVVVPKYTWTKQIYQRWSSDKILSGIYYVSHNDNVYLVLGNDEFNRTKYDAKIYTSIPPTHTAGVVTYDDGYTYLFLYTITATDKANVNSANWMSVPDKILTSHAGKITYASIDIDSISGSNLIIDKKEPEIPILSDTGSGAVIRLRTYVVSSPYATTSEKRYKIIGIDVINYGTSPYSDYNVTVSLQAILTNSSASQIADIASAITLGFSPLEGINVREVLEAKYALVTCQVDSDKITPVSDQREFYNFGVFENVTKDSGELLFTGSNPDETFSNNVKLTVAALGTGAVPDENDFDVNDLITSTSPSKVQSGYVASAVQDTPVTVKLEMQTQDKNLYEIGTPIKLSKTGENYTIVSLTKPNIKQGSGKSLHIGPARYTIASDELVNKRFFAQIIQRF